MITRRVTVHIIVGAVLCTAACNAPQKNVTAEKSSDAAMAAMPGMANMPATDSTKSKSDSGSITLNGAQIAHGNISWGAVTTSAMTGAGTVPGEVVPNEDRTAQLGAQVAGQILKVLVRAGDRVSAGQALVTMISSEATMVQADVTKADAELSARRSEAQYAAAARGRAERLLALKAIPQQDYDRAIADDENARAAVSQADAEIRRARTSATQLGATNSAVGEITLRSPANGVVLARTAVPGAVVAAGSPLVVVSDLKDLWLTISAPEPFAASFRRNGKLRFTVAAYPVDTFTARIEAVGAGLDPATRSLNVRALITDVARLKPQMLANVLIDGNGTGAGTLIPDDAVQLVQNKLHVFLAFPDGKGGARFQSREVVVGARSGGRIEVLRGISSSDVIVLKGAFAVKAEMVKGSMPKMEM